MWIFSWLDHHAADLPLLHCPHTVLFVDVHGSLTSSCSLHCLHCLHIRTFSFVENIPGGHRLHLVFFDNEHSWRRYCPGLHDLQGEHLPPFTSLNVPSSQNLHTVSFVIVHFSATSWPFLQMVHLIQCFWSSSVLLRYQSTGQVGFDTSTYWNKRKVFSSYLKLSTCKY